VKFKKIDHIALAVNNLEEASKTFTDMGFVVEKPHDVASMKVRAAFVKVGESQLELLEPTETNSVVHKFLEKRGEGMHHLCFEVDDIHKSLADLKEKDFQLVHEKPVSGAQGLVAFVHPKSCHGVLIELVQK